MKITRLNNRAAAFLIGPALTAMFVVHLIPIFFGIIMAFLRIDVSNLSDFPRVPFIGFDNFKYLFTDGSGVGQRFLSSIGNVLIYGLVTIPVGYVIALAVAMLLNREFKGRTIVRGLILLPYITPDAVMYNVWRFIFQSRVGIVNSILSGLGLIREPIIWLVGDNALIAVIVASIWKGWPFTSLMLLAALQTIPQDLYEAARLDNASWFQRLRYVTLPMLWPVSRTLLMLSVIWNFHAFNQFYVMLGADTASKAAVPSVVILREAFGTLHFGSGSAMAVIMLAIILLLTAIAVFTKRERSVE